MIGGRTDLNRFVLDNALERNRYRPLVIAASEDEPWLLEALRGRIAAGGVSVVGVETQPPVHDGGGKVMRMEGNTRGVLWSQVGSLKSILARKNVTSLLILPGGFDVSDFSTFVEFDKATLVIPGPISAQRPVTPWSFGDIEFDLEDVSITESDGFTEVTGYPSVREVA
jgi:hypothetical protein